jgi:SH3-like domain-containing protein
MVRRIDAISAAMKTLRFFAVLSLSLFLSAAMAFGEAKAQDRDLPYWASIRYDEVNMRVGPSQEYPIEWVYKRRGLPLKVLRLREGWRLVQDAEGTQGWISASQLSLTRGAFVIGDGLVDLRENASATSTLRWRAEPGVVATLLRCRDAFCEIDVAGRSGWVDDTRLWGAGEP